VVRTFVRLAVKKYQRTFIIITITEITNRDIWNNTLRQLPYAHILQSWEWGEFKLATTGWHPQRLAFERDGQIVAMASVGVRKVGFLKVMYVSKGPALDYSDTALFQEVITALENRAKEQRAIWLKIDPDVILATGLPDSDDDTADVTGAAIKQSLETRGWQFSDSQVQFRNTMSIDLTQSEDDILMAMSGNTRRKVRTATKKNVTIHLATIDDLPILYDLYQITGERDDFLTRPFEYYKRAWQKFMEADLAHALIAEYNGKPIAHVILFHFRQKCWYFYGASSNEERNRMPNYALQWEAMKWAKSQGYTIYDMWGAPDTFDEHDSMWGVYQFKQGFRGTVVRHIGAWDYAPSQLLYNGYTEIMPRLLNLMRR
jgi:peptidoglycan pentaglycine glycine transferase (the first glycine)